MADVISTCSENDTSGNTSNGGTWSVSLTAWEVEAQARFEITANREIVECYADYAAGFMSDGALSIADWGTTTATDYPYIRPAAGQGHDGVVGDGFIFVSNAFGGNISVAQDYTRVEGITIEQTATYAGYYTNAFPTTVHNCIFKGVSTVNNALITCRGGFATHTFTNNLVLCGDRASAVTIDNFTGGLYANNTVHFVNGGTGAGFNKAGASSTATFTNNVAFGAGEDIKDPSGGLSGTNNASGDTSASTLGLGTVTGIVGTAGVDFVDPANDNYNVQPSGKLDGAGADLSGSFTDDIAGNTRSVPWEIGAYEIAGAAPGVTFDGPDIVAQTGTENTLFSFNENGEGNVASRFTGATSYAYAPGSDTPAGITVNATTGNLEGTPTVNGTFNITIEGSD